MKKRFLSILLALCMVLTVLPRATWASSSREETNTTAVVGKFYILKPTNAYQDSSFIWNSSTGVGTTNSWIYAGTGTLDVQVDNPSIGSKYPALGKESQVLAQPDTLPNLTVDGMTYT